DWRGAVGRVALAEAAVLDGRLEDASERYLTAIEVFRRFGLPWDEAEAQNRFGRALLDGGDRRGAVETLAGALELYRRHGAGARWVERVLTDKLTAQGLSGQSFGASIDLVAAEVMKEAEDFFGANVALAARVAGAAQGGQILVSALLKERVESSGEFDFGPSWEAELKGISGTRRLHPVLWQESETP
ncbi:MAG: tetratricopeptide repeat protein, partial [Acidimicrobiia bacterium]